MAGKRRDKSRVKNLTDLYLSGNMEAQGPEAQQRFSQRSAQAQHRKMEQTALLRAAEEAEIGQTESLPTGEVVQVYSLFSDVEAGGVMRLCVVRKTMAKVAETSLVVGDHVRFRDIGSTDEQGRPEAVIERILPRTTVLTRADSFKAIEQQPIVANAEQMLIVLSLHEPEVRWGLVDRMIVAAQSGGLRPIVCLNKSDLAGRAGGDIESATEVLAHYLRLGIRCLESSITSGVGLNDLRDILRNKTTVLAGHSGVGKSSLIMAIEPSLDLRIGAISGYTGKGRHTTSSARRYRLALGGLVIDTPGVKLFGLWGVTRVNLPGYFPDVENGTAPQWRLESFDRIMKSLPLEEH
jgi:ribosome biogenesis GTPase